jgi:hypothetical protein
VLGSQTLNEITNTANHGLQYQYQQAFVGRIAMFLNA